MTLLTENSDISYAGLTGQDTFAYNFRVDLKTDMNITLDAVAVVQGDFTMTGLGSPSGGNVILNTALIADAVVILFRDVPKTQEVDYQPFDAFPSETHEGALDKLTMLVQQAFSIVSRALTFPIGDTTNTELPNIATRSNRFLGFDAVGDIAVLTGVNDPNAVQKPAGAVTAGNVIGFDAGKDAIDTGILASDLTRYAWPGIGSIVRYLEIGDSGNYFSMISGPTGTAPSIAQSGNDNIGINLEDIIFSNGTIIRQNNNIVGALIYRAGGDYNVADGVDSLAFFDTAVYDSHNFFDFATNQNRLVIPVGILQIKLHALVTWNAPPSAGEYEIQLFKNGSKVFSGGTFNISQSRVQYLSTPLLSVVSNDYFEINLIQNTGSLKNILSGSELNWFFLEVF